MRKQKTVTIKAQTLEEARASAKKFAEGEGLSPEEVAALVDAAEAEKPGGDEGKSYRVTALPVYQAEKWAIRALLALTKAGLNVPNANGGLSALAGLGLGAIITWLPRVPWEELEPLLDEMQTCFNIETESGVVRKIMPQADDITEISTILLLRKTFLEVHFDFFTSAES